MRFTRTLSVKHHPNGDHYSLSIPPVVAEALNLQDGGGLVSIEIPFFPSKKGQIHLQAYRDSEIAWREQFNPSYHKSILRVPVPPRTLGPSKPWATGKVYDLKASLREIRLATTWLEAEVRRLYPPRRGRRPKLRSWGPSPFMSMTLSIAFLRMT